MAAPRDHLFWKRFSAAVHQDAAEKEERSRPELKHSYVTSPSSSPPSTSPPQSPEPKPPQSPYHPRQSSSFSEKQDPKESYEVQRPPPALNGKTSTKRTSIKISTHILPSNTAPTPQRWPSTTKLPPSLARQPSKLKKSPPLTSHPSSPLPTRSKSSYTTRPTSTRFSLRHTNTSQLTLGLSGRPPSRFKFWTSITAGADNEDGFGANAEDRQSWLEAQLKKKRQRTWMCWLFWLVLAGVVAGVVVVVVFLRAKGVIG